MSLSELSVEVINMADELADDLLAGAAAAAAYSGLSQRVIYHLTETGALPVKRIGRRLYYRKSELNAVFGQMDTP
jgi:predicted DNA-binding transcriptional regulator AlpA